MPSAPAPAAGRVRVTRPAAGTFRVAADTVAADTVAADTVAADTAAGAPVRRRAEGRILRDLT
ncbi:hypothetical protein A6A08_10025 [Nocardiopsis sp. TSRI0078]|uniref:hypothetical protein n=1 Tax=Nocardiopsis sp. TSRI0078 TaxID=1718951 RepID=UPI00093C0976|nr:hypothetical protein [Nocardiopsis sp. TSRI0078]OKI15876.1 hypothetical protein A6A08_10025 [Nocardiopsis sp. TSRI0078]